MRSAAKCLTLASALLAVCGPADAIGFGRVVNASTLGQPLNFSATVRLEADETLARECIAAEVVSGESRLPNVAVRVTLEPGADPLERQIRVTTLAPVDEPIVTVNVTAGCVPRLSRSFVTLMDPPIVNLAQAERPVLPPQRVDSQVAPVLAAADAAVATPPARRAATGDAPPPRARPRRPAAVAAAAAPDSVDAPAPRASRPAAAPVRTAARPAAAGPRLKLEPPVQPAAVAASAAPRPGEAATAAVAAENAAVAAMAVQAAASAASAAEASQRRVAALEGELAALRRANEATAKSLAELQTELKQARNTRYANPLVYALAILSALLSVAVAVLWWRQSHPRGGTQWWLSPTGGAAGAATRSAMPPAVRRPPVEVASGAGKLETQPAVMDERPRSPVEEEPPTLTPPAAPVPTPVAASATGAPSELPVLRRELSVEELIDLEQQADFFVVLGQDEAAIDLLMGHVRSTGGVSPLPYLKLLEIYHRRGEHEAYERVRERFNRRFNAYAPDWGADLQAGKTLDDYPDMLIRLQRFWDEPSHVTSLLDESLIRQGEGGETFDLPAYRELLFLYSIARDLAEHPAAQGNGVDLLLPLEGESQEVPIEHLSASRLMGFAPTLAPREVDFDPSRAKRPGDAPKSDFQGLVGTRPKDGDPTGR
jgi:hypothetical protein